MEIRLAKKDLERGSIVDGPGIRAVLWTQGCPHNCPNCHNPETHSYDGGFATNTSEIKKQLDTLDIEEGITFSGGDPFEQVEACLEIAKYSKEKGLNIWCYTGNTYEELMKKSETNPLVMSFLKEIDVLVDGRFIQQQKSLEVKFRGSTNQRLIDVKKTLKNKKIVQLQLEKKETKTKKNKREVYL